jgi:AsmA protein
MKKLAKWLGLTVIGLLVVLVAAVLVLPNVLDWNGLKPRIAGAVKEATGRDLRIEGDIRISMWPDLAFNVSGVHIANAPGLTPPDMVSVGSVAGRLAIWPLLSHRIEVESLVVDKAAVDLAVDKDGKQNWAMTPATPTAPQAQAPSPTAETGPGWSVAVDELRLDGSSFRYADATTGQTLEAKDIRVATAMADPARPFSVNAEMTVNAEPVKATLMVDSPSKLMAGQKAGAKLSLASKWLNAGYDGSVQEEPTPGLDGVFTLDARSVGQLAAWLGRPLQKSQPDPGAVKLRAEFATDGAKTALKSATLEGAALSAKASGSFDGGGPVKKLTLSLESGVLDVDRYLPPPARKASPAAASAPAAAATAPLKDPFAAISNKPLDLGALKSIDADVKMTIGGIKAVGYEIGRIAFAATAKGGVLNADLSELALYGGGAKGSVKLNAAGKALDVDASIRIDHVAVDKIAAAAGGLPASGVVSAAFDLKAQGDSPRALAESVHGKLDLDLGGMTVKGPSAPAISGVKLALDVPAPDKPFSLKGSLVYNGERVDIDATLDAPRKIVSADKFAAKLALASKPVTLNYDGAVQARPAPGLDGTFDLDVPSVGRLAAWAGKPLDPKEPDPGPLKSHVVLAANGPKFAIKEASFTGKALKASAVATFDSGGKVPSFDAKLDIQQADVNAYLPAPARTVAPVKTVPPGTAQPKAPAAPAQAQAGWSSEPLNLAALGAANGQLLVQLGTVRYLDLDIKQGEIKATLNGGVLKVTMGKLALAQGNIASDVTLDGASPTAKLEYQASASGVQAEPLLKSFADSDRLSGTIAFQANGKASGKSEKELIETLNGAGQFKITDGAIHGINIAATLRKAGTLGFTNSATEKTDFAELSGTFAIKNGVLENHDLKMLAPLVRLAGTGTVPMPPQTIDYTVEAKLVETLEGQGGKDALAGVPIPIRITGPWSNINYQVDWKAVFTDIAKDPSKYKNLPANLQNAAKGFGVNLPGGATGAAGGALQKLFPGQGAPQPGAPPAPGGQQPQQPAVPALPKALKGLFGN